MICKFAANQCFGLIVCPLNFVYCISSCSRPFDYWFFHRIININISSTILTNKQKERHKTTSTHSASQPSNHPTTHTQSSIIITPLNVNACVHHRSRVDKAQSSQALSMVGDHRNNTVIHISEKETIKYRNVCAFVAVFIAAALLRCCFNRLLVCFFLCRFVVSVMSISFSYFFCHSEILDTVLRILCFASS